ncbi:hypothetical protein HFO25_30940 [Rhizobium laguerreae]|nr:hypothetical protein [Rhizobium laguerreae]
MAELAERGIKTERRAVWMFVRAEDLGFKRNGSADRADGEGQHAVPADEKTDRQEKFGIAGAKEAEGSEADSKGEGQEAPDVAPNPSGAKERRPGFKNREHHLWATVLDIRVPMMPKTISGTTGKSMK